MASIATSRFDPFKWVAHGNPALLAEPDCGIDIGADCLPVALPGDLQFQFVLTFATSDELMSFMIYDFTIQPLTPVVDYDTDKLAVDLYSAGTFEIHPISATSVLILWRGDMTMLNDIDEGQCFRLGVSVSYTDPDLSPSTVYNDFVTKTCFRKISTTGDDYCYTSTIEYRNEENGFGFYYCYTQTPEYWTNKFRAAFYLSRPQLPETRKVFAKADGSLQLVSSVIKKTYALRTDYMNEAKHEFLRIALAHDSVLIVNKNISEYFRQEEEYQIGWNDTWDMNSAMATSVVSVTPYAAINSNCDVCDLPPCGITSTRPTGSNFFHDQPGDPYFSSDAIIEIDLSEGVEIANCPGGVVYSLNEIDFINAGYISDVTIDPVTGIATVTMATIGPGTYVETGGLFTYQITCVDGECPLPGQVSGTIIDTDCAIPQGFDVVATMTGATITITPPVPFPECGIAWEIWDFDLTVMIMSGTFSTTPCVVEFTLADGYELGESYVIQARGNCCDGTFSEWDAVEFDAAEPDATCGRYEVSYLGPPGPHVFSYTNCAGNPQNDFIFTGETKTICAYQTVPGTPDSLTGVTSSSYLGLC